MADFLDKTIPLEESINRGLEFLSKKDSKYYLFDGSDSTSLMAAYEVFDKSNARGLFKHCKTTRAQYAKPTAFNKWFFGSGSELDLSYKIPNKIYNKIKLTGWNFGYYQHGTCPLIANHSEFLRTLHYKRYWCVCNLWLRASIQRRPQGSKWYILYPPQVFTLEDSREIKGDILWEGEETLPRIPPCYASEQM